ncbi:putative Signal transduction histidine kinase, VsrA [Thiomonas arsenitoxydans]|uniref:Signal transduction histidine kinase, VsrA n=1 Tax=Thiomonas arsenitoxydans (strain DSM 22701 / CIP 110005 / 3As) TaxID=426114 RepID=D6CQG1_THIA3|nr:putative Signal transduction histidine kinase,putative VsrA [Thiomonas arsenitoxydans]CQR32846.1 putative Signal transduction histidine kinase, VsrA [Thiomonas arsenitoxydans]CQR33119.1 putative Signal transduction histidine kinase, VsrA [Thiomonas arsenitoxydans]CQR33835.1 putative Signal transduction histidine kinase, VsrA [Thiomonas arsenitoxydans]CQR40188.1 putative Signal transduction histidine kinase, VsrA [Thiomonas arsenitoxydans]
MECKFHSWLPSVPPFQSPPPPVQDLSSDDTPWAAHPLSGFGLVFQLSQRAGQLQFTQASESAQMVCGLSAQALLRSSTAFVGRIHAADQADFHASVQASALHGEPWNWEGRILTEGEIKWINIRAAVKRLDATQVQWNGIMINISHARRRESDLRDMAAHMERAREQERARLARDMHDELGQLLTALKMDISLLRRRLGPDDAQLNSMTQLVDAATAAGRRVAAQLRPAVLDLGLSDGLLWLAEEFSQRYGIPVSHQIEGAGELDDLTAIQIFRIAQEAFTNIARHAQAKSVRLTLARTPGLIALDIVDDGLGFTPATQTSEKSFGLRGMRERAHLLGGTLDCASVPNHGTTLRVRVPCTERGTPADAPTSGKPISA